jgi:hypothetical protein
MAKLLTDTQTATSAWDPATQGFGKHTYRQIDPAEINVADYAVNLRGDEAYRGEVREYITADNLKHPDNDATLDWLTRLGTEFSTNAEGYEGIWKVTYLPRVRSPHVFIVARRTDAKVDVDIRADFLGVVADPETNLFPQVVTKLLKRGKISRTMLEESQKPRGGKDGTGKVEDH